MITEAEKVALLHTPVFQCGGTVDVDTVDTLISGGGARYKLHNFIEYTTSYTTIGNCPVRPHGEFKTYGSNQLTRVGYRVAAVFAISSAASVTSRFGALSVDTAPPLDLDVQLLLTDRDGSATQVDGGTSAFPSSPTNPHPVGEQTTLPRGFYDPIGYLLRIHHINRLDTQAPNDHLGHSMAGMFPEDTWRHGKYIYYESEIIDTVDVEIPTNAVPARLLSIQVRGGTVPEASWGGTGTPAPKSYIHLLSWTVVGLDVPRPGLLTEVGV
jgi:hypothetical protein